MFTVAMFLPKCAKRLYCRRFSRMLSFPHLDILPPCLKNLALLDLDGYYAFSETAKPAAMHITFGTAFVFCKNWLIFSFKYSCTLKNTGTLSGGLGVGVNVVYCSAALVLCNEHYLLPEYKAHRITC